jgi:hypothetical protein
LLSCPPAELGHGREVAGRRPAAGERRVGEHAQMLAQQFGWSTSIRGGSPGDPDKPGIFGELRCILSARLPDAPSCRHPWALPSNVNHPLTAPPQYSILAEDRQ